MLVPERGLSSVGRGERVAAVRLRLLVLLSVVAGRWGGVGLSVVGRGEDGIVGVNRLKVAITEEGSVWGSIGELRLGLLLRDRLPFILPAVMWTSSESDVRRGHGRPESRSVEHRRVRVDSVHARGNG
jgi:hypothetical protein